MIPRLGRSILITGASRGLGRALCRAFGAHGDRVAFTFSADAGGAAITAEQTQQAGALEVRPRQVSVLDAEGTATLVDELERDWGGIDVLINNAGITQPLPLPLVDEADWDRVMDVNVKGVFITSKAVARSMMRRKQGVILNIGSLAGHRMIDVPVHYAASKAAVEGLTRAMAKQLGRYRIRVVCLAPGLLDDGVARAVPAHRKQDYIDHSALGRLVSTDEVARVAVELTREDSFITGETITVDGCV
jgi:NAD(P)-dependent dehydrogenase (short-subunit alcohol dehydrogenase family)